MLCKKTKGTITCVYESYNEVSGALERGCVQKRGQGTQACNICAFAHWNSWYVYILKKNYCTWKSKLGPGQNRKLHGDERGEVKYIIFQCFCVLSGMFYVPLRNHAFTCKISLAKLLHSLAKPRHPCVCLQRHQKFWVWMQSFSGERKNCANLRIISLGTQTFSS